MPLDPKVRCSEIQGKMVLFVVNISGISLVFSGQFGQLLPYFPRLKYVLSAS